MLQKYEKIGNHIIYFEKMYYIAYAGGHRELSKEKQRNWDRTLQLPGILKTKEQNKLGLMNNPNVVPIKGIDLLSFFRELGFIPFFDSNWSQSGVLQLTDAIIYESIKQKSYDIALQT